MRQRVINPSAPTDDFAARRQGVRTQRETDLSRDRQGKTNDDTRGRVLFYPTQTIRFARDEVSSSGEQVLRLADSSTMQFTTALRYPFGAAGRFIGGVLATDTSRSAGSAAVRVRLSKGGGTETVYDFTDWVIDGQTVDGHVRDMSAALLIPVPNGLRFAKGDACRVSVNFTGYTPDLSDWIVDLLVAYDGLTG